MSYTVDDLINKIRLWGSIPPSDNMFPDSQLLVMLNDEQVTTSVPLVLSIREEHFLDTVDYTVTGTSDINESFDIPANSIGMGLRDVVIVDDNGQESSIPQFKLTDKRALSTRGYSVSNVSTGFEIYGNKIRLRKPVAYKGKTLRIYYYRRPDVLVSNSNGGLISTVTDLGGGSWNVNLVSRPNSWSTSADTYDLSQGSVPYNKETRGVTLTVSATSFTYTGSELPDGLAAGNWITLTGKSVIPMMPIEVIDHLAQSVVIKCLEAMGTLEENQGAVAKLQQQTKFIKDVLSPRIDGEEIPFKGNPYLWSSI